MMPFARGLCKHLRGKRNRQHSGRVSASRCGLRALLIAVPEKISRPNNDPAIFLKSIRGEFRVHQTLDLMEDHAKGLILCAFHAVKIQKVAQGDVQDSTLDRLLEIMALKEQALRPGLKASRNEFKHDANSPRA